jgi:phosphogluconate dehydratase
MAAHPGLLAITEAIRLRSRRTRAAYLAGIEAMRAAGPSRHRLSCANLAHGFAGAGPDQPRLRREPTPNLGIVNAYNDMLSAHQPFEDYPAQIREVARRVGATAQVAGGVPAMCDGVTQGRAGMDLSLFSRDVIAQSTAIALSHDMFDAALCLGVCDKIVPGLLIGSLAFGHLPVVFAPAGPMTPGLSNREKAAVRERFAAGLATREELLEAESASYHSAGTCTFYGTANSNQVMLEAMGLQLPGSFVNPGTPLRAALTEAATLRAIGLSALGDDYRPIGRLVDERAIVNAIVALVATGGSTNHTIHWVAVARAAGIVLTWDDIDALAQAVPLLARVYPNGAADVNRFAAAGGIPYVFRELLEAGWLHGDIETILPAGMAGYTREPRLPDGMLAWDPGLAESADRDVVRPVAEPFEATGGLRLLQGNLGRAMAKVSAVALEHRRIEAPAVVVDNPQALNKLHAADALPRDFVAVVRFQGPRANGMPELHSLTPLLGMMQNQGRRVALVTDGRLSGASGKILSAIHVTPEAIAGGPLARLRQGDIVRIDADAGLLDALVDAAEFAARSADADSTPPAQDLGRNLFAFNRAMASPADQGALSISCGPLLPDRHGEQDVDAEYALGPPSEAIDAPHAEKDA